ncbi:MAG: hypothetical protein RLZZ244_2534, partial [Verrucomicrobiota bacterium]
MTLDSLEELRPTEPSASAADTLSLELGDFLHRIPRGFLSEEAPHDTTIPLVFGRDDMEARINRGETTIPISILYKQAPSIFKDASAAESSTPVRLPWQKVVRLLSQTIPKPKPQPQPAAPEPIPSPAPETERLPEAISAPTP